MSEPITELGTKVLICVACRSARALQPPEAKEWFCGDCARKGLIWAAKMAARRWWRRWLCF